jgi:hypothetical protein
LLIAWFKLLNLRSACQGGPCFIDDSLGVTRHTVLVWSHCQTNLVTNIDITKYIVNAFMGVFDGTYARLMPGDCMQPTVYLQPSACMHESSLRSQAAGEYLL